MRGAQCAAWRRGFGGARRGRTVCRRNVAQDLRSVRETHLLAGGFVDDGQFRVFIAEIKREILEDQGFLGGARGRGQNKHHVAAHDLRTDALAVGCDHPDFVPRLDLRDFHTAIQLKLEAHTRCALDHQLTHVVPRPFTPLTRRGGRGVCVFCSSSAAEELRPLAWQPVHPLTAIDRRFFLGSSRPSFRAAIRCPSHPFLTPLYNPS